MLDMHIEYNGRNIATVRSYTMRRSEEDSYCLELNCVYLTADAIHDKVDLERVCGFDFVVPKHDRIIKYRRCVLLATCNASRGQYEKLWIDAKNRTEEEVSA